LIAVIDRGKKLKFKSSSSISNGGIAKDMEEKLTARERKCPKCGSLNIVATGYSHVTGSGKPMREADQFQYKCTVCDTRFWYLGNTD